tara:strand:+ start:514 stop:1095 length:582 start_codon:yes stop_codon:yes gene_type:complete
MKKKYLFLMTIFIGLFFNNCSKKEKYENTLLEGLEEEEQLESCVDYTSVDPDKLESYWDLFVEDVKCSRGGPNYDEINKTVTLYFIVPTAETVASGVTVDHAGYSTYAGYCNSEAVNIGVIEDYWIDYTEIQKLWLMYHEFGHDVYRYRHSTDPTDIMYPSVARSDVKINDFIRAKERFLKRTFDGIVYINCD